VNVATVAAAVVCIAHTIMKQRLSPEELNCLKKEANRIHQANDYIFHS
jgi:hypothetical protein